MRKNQDLSTDLLEDFEKDRSLAAGDRIAFPQFLSLPWPPVFLYPNRGKSERCVWEE